jgi:hypothetical protein
VAAAAVTPILAVAAAMRTSSGTPEANAIEMMVALIHHLSA